MFTPISYTLQIRLLIIYFLLSPFKVWLDQALLRPGECPLLPFIGHAYLHDTLHPASVAFICTFMSVLEGEPKEAVAMVRAVSSTSTS